MVTKEDRWLVDNIIQYVEENNRKYAVAIEGPWGVGKTRFLKSVLAPALKDHKKRMVRVSMFGMENSNDLYEKIGITLLRLERDDGVKRKASITVFFKNLGGMLSVALKLFGFSPKINITFKDVADLVPSDKHVFVFDDVERRSKSSDDLSLFGAVNELVEGRGAKVIFVTSNLGADSEGQRPFNSEVREKLVWKVFAYEQSTESLVNDIFGHLEDSVSEINIIDCILESVRKSDCVNVRAMLKVEPIVTEILKTNVISDRTIFLGSRKQAFVDIVMFALMFCDDRPPVPPKQSRDENVNDSITLRSYRDYVEYLHPQQLKYEKYKDAMFISAYFEPRAITGRFDWNKEIRNYMRKWYSNSEDDQKIVEIASLVGENIKIMDDIDVIPLVLQLSTIIRNRRFSAGMFYRVIIYNQMFVGLGFDQAVPKDELINCCKSVIACDLEASIDSLSVCHSAQFTDRSTFVIVDELYKYAASDYIGKLKAEIDECVNRDGKVNEVLNLLLYIERFGGGGLLSISPSYVAQIFFKLNPDGQEKMRRLFCDRGLNLLLRDKSCENRLEWLNEFKRALTETDSHSHMTELRKGWFLESIDDLLKQVSHVELSQVSHVELS